MITVSKREFELWAMKGWINVDNTAGLFSYHTVLKWCEVFIKTTIKQIVIIMGL